MACLCLVASRVMFAFHDLLFFYMKDLREGNNNGVVKIVAKKCLHFIVKEGQYKT